MFVGHEGEVGAEDHPARGGVPARLACGGMAGLRLRKEAGRAGAWCL